MGYLPLVQPLLLRVWDRSGTQGRRGILLVTVAQLFLVTNCLYSTSYPNSASTPALSHCLGLKGKEESGRLSFEHGLPAATWLARAKPCAGSQEAEAIKQKNKGT